MSFWTSVFNDFITRKYDHSIRKKGKTQTEDYYVVIEEAWKPLKVFLLKLYLSLVLLIIVVCDSSNTKSNLLLILVAKEVLRN